MQWWLAYLGIGSVVGFFAGLLGIGGGMVMVPMLAWAFTAQGLPAEHIVHLALGTSMATIMFTSVSSMRAHHAHDAVDWQAARVMAPGILTGSFLAALAAGLIPTRPLAVMFTLLVFYAATQILFDLRPKRTREMPGALGVFAAGAGIGAISSLLAAGGAFMCIPFLAWCSVPLRRAIGTAAAVGLPIAAAGTAGYVLQGLRAAGLPSATLGYVYLPALAMVVVTSMLAAPLGARVAHRVPVKRLRIIFAVVLYALATRMLTALW
ncbi:MAG: sulfite exporter TauE/SafE family protein [Betaproteobacteria bacterium]|nr:MAG: sulfite exporter TauE/SafE family protein [Betaproteobacteria bacterium]